MRYFDRREFLQQSAGLAGLIEFAAVPMVSKAHVMALTSGDSWLNQGANLLLFGPPEPAS